MGAMHGALALWVVMLAELVLFTVRLDGTVAWNWFYIFTPTWLLALLLTVINLVRLLKYPSLLSPFLPLQLSSAW